MNEATAHAAHFFLQLAVILVACRLCGIFMRRIGQPPVIGEMMAGVLLGPSLLGAIAPGVMDWIFPEDARPMLFAVAQLGLTLYMFSVGLEFRSDLLRSNLRTAAAVSVAGIVTPFVLGCLLALWLVGHGGFFSTNVSPLMAALFLGAAMSITAFPMLARMIVEHRMTGTPAGTIALTAGSIDDAAAWILLAAVLGGISGSPLLLGFAIGGGALYVLFCSKVLRPLMAWMHRRLEDRTVLGMIVLFLALGAWFTDLIGLYSVFGAFFLGLCVPKKNDLAEKTAERIGPLTSALLLPVFFTYSGLHTRLGLLDTGFLWLVCGLIILAAVAGKLLACYTAARATGSPPADALAIGSLMNARGLMELILLNIGRQAGIISDTLFTILVVMAVVTTLMAAPGFNASRRLAASGC
jgi:Kef-type K+ transport system membrane component KefB